MNILLKHRDEHLNNDDYFSINNIVGIFDGFKRVRSLYEGLTLLNHKVSFNENILESIDLIFWLECPSWDMLNLYIHKYPEAINYLWIMESPIIVSVNHEIEYYLNFKIIFSWEIKTLPEIKHHHIGYDKPFYKDVMHYFERPKSKGISMVCANKYSRSAGELYSLRKSIIDDACLNNRNFYLYGQGWEKFHYWNVRGARHIGNIFKFLHVPPSVYKGAVADKLDCISRYDFSFAIENSFSNNGYVTEKIFDCLAAGTIPIYYGDSCITEYVPKSCFIDFSKFNSLNDLYDYLWSLTDNDLLNIREEIKYFLKLEENTHSFYISQVLSYFK